MNVVYLSDGQQSTSKPKISKQKRSSKAKKSKKSKKTTWKQHRFHRAKVKGNFLFMLLGIPTDVVVLTKRAGHSGKKAKSTN